MISNLRNDESAPRRRRYLVHLLCPFDREDNYIVRIRPWAGRHGHFMQIRERAFADERELIATINQLLPAGSDVRDVFGHIETENGFYYLLHLTDEEAYQLGWTA